MTEECHVLQDKGTWDFKRFRPKRAVFVDARGKEENAYFGRIFGI